MQLKISVPGRITKGRARRGAFGRMYTPADTENTENLIKWTFAKQYPQFKPIETPVSMKITAFFIRAKGNKMIMPMLKPDADNTAKVCCDALNKLAYLDDKQIVRLVIEKHWCAVERVEIEIEETQLF
jgi:Holliday junction resolvase RusA-like endonuclease